MESLKARIYMYILLHINIVITVMLMLDVIRAKNDFQQLKRTVLVAFYFTCSMCNCGKKKLIPCSEALPVQ